MISLAAPSLTGTAGIDLARTLESGQAFRWRWTAGGPRIATGSDDLDGAPSRTPAVDSRFTFMVAGRPSAGRAAMVATGIVGRRVVRLAQGARGIRLLSPEAPGAAAALRRYLGAEPRARHPRRVEAVLAADPVLARVLTHTAGIALLAQDPWETLITFVVSQNNNIPKITGSIDRLARALGEPIGGGAFAFPSPDRLAAAPMPTLAACALGYRAPYVRAAARLVAEGRLDLAALSRMGCGAAREALLAVPGIGDKVGDCVLLFGLGHHAAFPVDVWVRRAVERLYFRGRPRRLADIRAFAAERWGPLAGYAQQHLFAYARSRLRP